jgi:hypothetical protein
MKIYIFRTVPLSIIRSFSLYTQQWYMPYRFTDSLRAGSEWICSSILILLASCKQNCMTFTIAVCTLKTPDDGQRNCPKHVEFHFGNKFEKLVHLVGIIIRKVFFNIHLIGDPNFQSNFNVRFDTLSDSREQFFP